jgi:hypothetical protein
MIEVSKSWIVSRLFWFVLAGIGILTGMAVLGLTLILVTSQRTFHEFAHAAAALVYGGIVEKVQLGPGNIQEITCIMPKRALGPYYFAGLLFDIMMLGACCFLLMSSGNLWYYTLGYCLILIGLFFHLIPDKSDLNMWKSISGIA